jgi:hypothetical protein
MIYSTFSVSAKNLKNKHRTIYVLEGMPSHDSNDVKGCIAHWRALWARHVKPTTAVTVAKVGEGSMVPIPIRIWDTAETVIVSKVDVPVCVIQQDWT